MNKIIFAIAVAVTAQALPSFAQTNKSDFERNKEAVNREYDRQQAEKTRETMRDKSHDNRVMVDKDTSVGGSAGEKGVSVDVKKGF